ncbi:NAD(P)-binding domain [Phytophthora cactorum]|nr:NAD(P)-binding domain [Phytophthora cactorum]
MASTKKTVLIIGSTRGIGLAFVEHYTKAGWNVIGTARANSNTEKMFAFSAAILTISCVLLYMQLKALGPFKVVAMDTSDELPSSRQLVSLMFEVNAVGPFLVTRALLPNLQLAAKANGGASVAALVLLGSIGSYTNDTVDSFKRAGFGYGYSSSKAALNMITSGIVVVSVHPGYVDTDLTQGKATLNQRTLNPESTGKFFKPDPVSELPW